MSKFSLKIKRKTIRFNFLFTDIIFNQTIYYYRHLLQSLKIMIWNTNNVFNSLQRFLRIFYNYQKVGKKVNSWRKNYEQTCFINSFLDCFNRTRPSATTFHKGGTRLRTWTFQLFFQKWHWVRPVCKTTLGTLKLWPLLRDGRCSATLLCYKHLKQDPKKVVVVGRWSLFGGGH